MSENRKKISKYTFSGIIDEVDLKKSLCQFLPIIDMKRQEPTDGRDFIRPLNLSQASQNRNFSYELTEVVLRIYEAIICHET